jgi:hypothetical protein
LLLKRVGRCDLITGWQGQRAELILKRRRGWQTVADPAYFFSSVHHLKACLLGQSLKTERINQAQCPVYAKDSKSRRSHRTQALFIANMANKGLLFLCSKTRCCE